MSNETDNIEAWTSTATNQVRDEIAAQSLEVNEKNRLWWEKLPMTYEDWGKEDRDPVSVEDFDRVDRHYFGTNPYLQDYWPELGTQAAKVLEVGCGAGSAACRFASQGASVQAVDITAKAVELTKRHAEVSDMRGVQALQCDAEDLSPLADASFDYLYSWGVMHHSAHPECCFAQACLKLKPGGRGLIMVYHRHSLRFWLKGLFWLVLKGRFLKGETIESVQRHFTDGFYQKHYSRETLRKAMEEAGFVVEAVRVTHMSSRMIPFIPEGLRQWLKQRIGWLIVAHVRRA
ncbi:MAG: class I SAM-dependent methyltransferase [Verrucomicrobiota bacterium]